MQTLGLARSSTYIVLNDLLKVGLIKKTTLAPVSYFAENPEAAYSNHLQQLSMRLKRGRDLISKLMNHSSRLSEELYLIEVDGGPFENIRFRRSVVSRRRMLFRRAIVGSRLSCRKTFSCNFDRILFEYSFHFSPQNLSR
jgi:sugar-specific transcriptional regulator TrmB